MLNLIGHRNDNSAVIPQRELRKLVYGTDSVFARSPTASQIASVTSADITNFLHAWERPDGAVFGMAGASPVAASEHSLVWACMVPIVNVRRHSCLDEAA